MSSIWSDLSVIVEVTFEARINSIVLEARQRISILFRGFVTRDIIYYATGIYRLRTPYS